MNTLSVIGEKLNDHGVLWGVGASILLSQYGLVNRPNDIDILVAVDDVERVDEILSSLGERKPWEADENYATKFFLEYVINGIDVDVMAGLTIHHSEGTFEYTFDKASVSRWVKIKGVAIPFTSMEDWYVIYQLIPGRVEKVMMIEHYLHDKGIKQPELLKRMMRCNLPDEVREKINNLLAFHGR